MGRTGPGKHASSAKAVGSFVPQLTRKAFEKYGFSTATLLTDWAVIVGPDGSETDIAPQLRLAMDWIAPAGSALPQIPSGAHVEIEVSAGYGAWSAVPADLAQGILGLAAHIYDGGDHPPRSVDGLLAPYVVAHLGGFGT